MPLSTVPSTGVPTIPSGAKTVSLKDVEVATATPKEDVTTLADASKQYASPPLIDTLKTTATKTCSVTGNLKSDTTLALTANNVNTGWICESYEKSYEVGKYATYSAEFSFYPAS
jgi:hypothetical protein